MKTRINTLLACVSLAAMVAISCKKTDGDNTEAVTTEEMDNTSTAVDGGDAGARSVSGSIGDGSGGNATGTEGFDDSGSTSGSGPLRNSNNTSEMSGDGSDGRTNSTAVNKSKKIQVGKKSSTKSGYSAPDGSAKENSDGDMYTKHDTTRMPSGSVPIK